MEVGRKTLLDILIKLMKQLTIDERFLQLRPEEEGELLGQYESFREFFTAFGNWCENTDFTYRDEALNDPNELMAQFVASHWIDMNLPLDHWDGWEDGEKRDFLKQASRLGINVATLDTPKS